MATSAPRASSRVPAHARQLLALLLCRQVVHERIETRTPRAMETLWLHNIKRPFVCPLRENEHAFTPFRGFADVTPPLGHPLCSGWLKPAKVIDDPLRAGHRAVGRKLFRILRLIGAACAAMPTWPGAAWPGAAHTTPKRGGSMPPSPRYAFVDLGPLLSAAGLSLARMLISSMPPCKSRDRPSKSLRKQPASRTTARETRVHDVASNRRVLGPDGKVQFWRGSATPDAKARAAPQGLIDPWLKVLGFWNGDTPLAALHFYASHPMSYYGKGRVSSDFCGLARERRQDDLPSVRQLYFNGAAGNIAAGKYNDGAPANRRLLSERIYEGMKAAWAAMERRPVTGWTWHAETVSFEPRSEEAFSRTTNTAILGDAKATTAGKAIAAFQSPWLNRLSDRSRAVLAGGTCSGRGTARSHSSNIQLFAQAQRKDGFICTAGYGDGGPGYIPTRHAYDEGGYETTVALAAPSCEDTMQAAIRNLLKS